MITSIPYDQIITELGGDFNDNYGTTFHEADSFLCLHGYATSRLWRYKARNVLRDPWPPNPWADVHLVQVDVSGGSHFILWLGDGTVLDPNRDDRPTLNDPAYTKINQIAGVHKFTRLTP